jgi:hypothetical protein
MATATWNTPSAQGSNIASTTLDSLANGSTSAFITHDNSTNLDLYANIDIQLGSFTSTTGASITLRVFSTANAAGTVPDATGSVNGGDTYTVPITVGASAKSIVIPMIRLYPFSMRLCVTNNGGAALAASSNTLKVQPFNEKVV